MRCRECGCDIKLNQIINKVIPIGIYKCKYCGAFYAIEGIDELCDLSKIKSGE